MSITTDPRVTAALVELDAAEPPVGPCPAWCALRPGHGWDGTTRDGRLCRGHARAVGPRIEVGALEVSGEGVGPARVSVTDVIQPLDAAGVRQLLGELVAALGVVDPQAEPSRVTFGGVVDALAAACRPGASRAEVDTGVEAAREHLANVVAGVDRARTLAAHGCRLPRDARTDCRAVLSVLDGLRGYEPAVTP